MQYVILLDASSR